MKAYKVFAIIFSVIALIGLIRFVGKMTPVNAGGLHFPCNRSDTFRVRLFEKEETINDANKFLLVALTPKSKT